MTSCHRCGDNLNPFDAETSLHCNFCAGVIAEEKAAKPKRHTYIHTLQEESAAKDTRIAELEEKIQDVVTYLHSPKFNEPDSWVSIYDILRMLGRY